MNDPESYRCPNIAQDLVLPVRHPELSAPIRQYSFHSLLCDNSLWRDIATEVSVSLVELAQGISKTWRYSPPTHFSSWFKV
jgi:hypothetical protein